MTILTDETIQQILEAAKQNPDDAYKLLAGALQVAFPGNGNGNGNGDEDNAPTIPDDPDLSNIRYLTLLRKTLRGRRPDPLILVALRAIFKKWGYPLLAKVVARVARKMRFPLRTQEVQEILDKYGLIVEPLLAIILYDIIQRYYQLSREQSRTMELDIKS